LKKRVFLILFSIIFLISHFVYTEEDTETNTSVVDEDALFSIVEDPLPSDAVTEDTNAEDDLSSIIDDPFAVDESDTPAIDDSPSDTEIISTNDLDSLFTDDMFEELDQTKQNAAPFEELLKSEGLIWGGKFSGAADSSWDWNIFDPDGMRITEPASVSIDPTAGADLYFNARPEKDFRVYGKLKIRSGTESAGFSNLLGFTITQDSAGNFVFGPSTTQTNNTTPDDPNADDDSQPPDNPPDVDADTNQIETNSDYNSDDAGPIVYPAADKADKAADEETTQNPGALTLSISVFELFADFNWKDALFFRFGKHTIKWGVGYFWSPVDVLNLTPIDTEDPTADREGPLSLKIHYPFAVNNAYLYLIANQAAEPLDIALAPKVEFVVGNAEIGIGAFYQRNLAPRLVSMLKTSLSDFDVFGECAVSYGSDRVFIKKSRNQAQANASLNDDLEIVLETYEDKTSLFFSATTGILYTNSKWNMNIMAQYYFNAEGYNDSEMLTSAYYLSQNSDANGLYIADDADKPDDYEDPPALSTNDLMNFGKHYAAFSLSFSKLFGIEDLNFSLFTLANLSDFSGIITPAISYKFFNKFNLNISVRTTFGNTGAEYTNPAAVASDLFGGSNSDDPPYKGPTFSLSVKLSMGNGSF